MEKRKKSDNSPNNPKETQETTLRQNQKKILTKKDLTNLDDFIQKCLNMFKFVDPKEEFYIATGKEKDLIISHKSTIPDLVIWNKTFNKNECFEEANTKKPNPFPRYQFFLRIKSTKSEKDKKKEKKNEKKEKKSEKSHKNKKKSGKKHKKKKKKETEEKKSQNVITKTNVINMPVYEVQTNAIECEYNMPQFNMIQENTTNVSINSKTNNNIVITENKKEEIKKPEKKVEITPKKDIEKNVQYV